MDFLSLNIFLKSVKSKLSNTCITKLSYIQRISKSLLRIQQKKKEKVSPFIHHQPLHAHAREVSVVTGQVCNNKAVNKFGSENKFLHYATLTIPQVASSISNLLSKFEDSCVLLRMCMLHKEKNQKMSQKWSYLKNKSATCSFTSCIPQIK